MGYFRTNYKLFTVLITTFFRPSPIRKLMYHNVLYDTSCVSAVNSALT